MNNVYQHAHMNDTEFDICVCIYTYIYIGSTYITFISRVLWLRMLCGSLAWPWPKGAGNRGIEGRVHMPGHVAPMRVGYGKAVLMKLGSAQQSETTQSSGFALEWMT